MRHLPPPWIIDELDSMRRRRSEREQPRPELPLPPRPTPSDDEAPEAGAIVVIDPAGPLTDR